MRPIRRAATVALLLLALPCFLGALTAWLLGVFPSLQLLSTDMALAASLIHGGLIGWSAALVLTALAALVARRAGLLVLILPLLLGLVWQVAWVAPYYRSDHGRHTEPLRIAVLNVLDGQGSVNQFLRETRDADMVVVIEITAALRTELVARGFTARHPYQVHARSGIPGTSIYSRFPLDDLGQGSTEFGSPLVRVHSPAGPILVMGAHPVNALGGRDRWVRDAAHLRSWIAPHLSEPLVVAGDFNAIDRHATMRPLRRLRLALVGRAGGIRLPTDVAGRGPGRRAAGTVSALRDRLRAGQSRDDGHSTRGVPGAGHRPRRTPGGGRPTRLNSGPPSGRAGGTRARPPKGPGAVRLERCSRASAPGR